MTKNTPPFLRGRQRHNPNPNIIVAVIGAIALVVAAITGIFNDVPKMLVNQFLSTPTWTASPTWMPTPIPPEDAPFRTCKAPSNTESFAVFPDYDPSGYMGDIGDLTVAKEPEVIRFTYEADGRGPHEFEFKFIPVEEISTPQPDAASDTEPVMQLNPRPAQFTGVMYLNPPNNFGERSDGGLDLRNFSQSITWEARSLTGEVNVEFIIGGVTWIWDEATGVKVDAPYPDSMDRTPLGIYTLTPDWEPFTADLSDIPEEDFQCVVGGFAWVISWGSNGVELNAERTGAEEPKTFIIEIRNIEYHGVEP